MKTSTEIGSIAKIVGYEKAIELVAKAGFDAWDFTMVNTMWRWGWAENKEIILSHPLNEEQYLSYVRKLKKIGLDNGIICNQSHAPFPSHLCGDKWLLRAIECTAEAGGQICVIHPDNNLSAEGNAEMYNRLLPFAKQHGVKIATENMWNWNHEGACASPAACSSSQDFVAHLKAVDDEYFVACLDIGHAEMMGLETSAVEMIKALGIKLQALHIHDNDRRHDNHQIPFSMNIDFKSIANALKEINYSGYYTLEADAYLAEYTGSNVFQGVKNLRESLVKLETYINN